MIAVIHFALQVQLTILQVTAFVIVNVSALPFFYIAQRVGCDIRVYLYMRSPSDRLLLIEGAHRWITQQHQQGVVLGDPVRDGVITFLVVQAVVIHVMRRDPGE